MKLTERVKGLLTSLSTASQRQVNENQAIDSTYDTDSRHDIDTTHESNLTVCQAKSAHFSQPRFYLALSAACMFAASSTLYITHEMQSTEAWTQVYTNGKPVGFVPTNQDIVSGVKRLAEGYGVPIALAPVHIHLPSAYDWQTVASLPTQATAVQLNGKTIVLTKSQEDAHLVLAFVKQSLTPKGLSANAKVGFSGDLVLAQKTVSAADVMSQTQAIRYILHPSVQGKSGRSIHFIGRNTLHTGNLSVAGVTNGLRRSVDSSPGATNQSQPSGSGSKTSALWAPSDGQGTTAKTTPLINVEASDMVLKTSSVAYPVHYVNNSHLGKGTTKVIRVGKPGRVRERVVVHYLNGSVVSEQVATTTALVQAKPEVVERGTNAGVADGTWQWPCADTDITSPFGPRILGGVHEFHPGIDIGCPIGTPVYASNNGVVEDAGWNAGGYGNWIRINNGSGIESIYGHLSKPIVKAGDTVYKGELIGYSGDTGEATGPHLHYEIDLFGKPINPSPYM